MVVRVDHRPPLTAQHAKLVRLAAQPAEHLRVVDRVAVLLPVGERLAKPVVGGREVEPLFADPVPARRRRAEVVVLEVVAHAGAGRLAAAMPDRVDGDEDRTGRRGGVDRPPDTAVVAHVVLRELPHGVEEVGAGQHLGRPQFPRHVLRVVEDLQVVERRPVRGVAVAVPELTRRGTGDAVVAHQDRQSEVAAEQRPHRPRRVALQDHAVQEPVLTEDVARFPVAGLQVLHGSPVDVVADDRFQHQEAPLAELQHLRVGQGRLAVVQSHVASFHRSRMNSQPNP